MPETNLYEFDAEFINVGFNANPTAENPHIVYHKLRKPTLAELIEREGQIKYELVEISAREDELQADDEIANARLWDKIAVSVKGYRGADDWRELTDEDKAAMRAGHKTAAIRTMYAGACEIEGGDDPISIGADVWTVKQAIGVQKDAPDFVVQHILREPTEAERVKFKGAASSTSYVKGAKKSRVRVRTNLKAYVELYDALINLTIGGTVGGSEFGHTPKDKAAFLAAIDPVWKRQIIHCLMSALEAQLSD
jgi:hypothetical protein